MVKKKNLLGETLNTVRDVAGTASSVHASGQEWGQMEKCEWKRSLS